LPQLVPHLFQRPHHFVQPALQMLHSLLLIAASRSTGSANTGPAEAPAAARPAKTSSAGRTRSGAWRTTARATRPRLHAGLAGAESIAWTLGVARPVAAGNADLEFLSRPRLDAPDLPAALVLNDHDHAPLGALGALTGIGLAATHLLAHFLQAALGLGHLVARSP
jgi:hypothetical protein